MSTNSFMQFIQSMMGDEFLSKALILSMITGLLVYFKNVPNTIWQRIRRYIVFTITIEQNDELFDYVERWFKSNYSKKYRNVIANINYRNFALNNDEPSKDNNMELKVDKIEYRQNQDVIYIKRNGVLIRIDKGRDKLEHAKSLQEMFFDKYNISCFFFKTRLMSFLDEIVEYNQQFKPRISDVSVYNYDGYNGWNRIKSITPKTINSIILDKTIKKQILDDVTNFTKNKQWYIDRSIPYKRGYLFYGAPGNGKTSLSLALAQYINRDIYTLVISEVRNDSDLKYLFNRLTNNAILLIEDIDAVFLNRESTDKVSFSALLNCLDGIYYNEGIITIMTTNHIEKLDAALIRDGRIDMKVEIENPKEQQVKEYVELFYNTKLNGEVYNNKGYSMATIQNKCIVNNELEIKKALFNS